MKKEEVKSYMLAFSLLITIPLSGIIYVSLNHQEGKIHSLVTDLDRQIPFLKVFIVPYLSWFIFLLIAFLYLAYKNRRVFFQTIWQFNIGLLICYGVYAFYQTYVPRPKLIGNDWLTHLVQWVYHSDLPFNCFPSTHVLTSYLMMKAYFRASTIPRQNKIIVTIMSILIIVSTQFIKQHVLLDIFGAIVVAEGVIYLHSHVQKGIWRKHLLMYSHKGAASEVK